MVADGTISIHDMQLLLVTDSIEEAVKHIKDYTLEQLKQQSTKKRKPIWFLGEKK